MTIDKETFIKFIQDQGLVNVTKKLDSDPKIIGRDLYYGLPTLSPYSWIARIHENKIIVVNKITITNSGINTFVPIEISNYFDIKSHIKYLIERSNILLKEVKEDLNKEKAIPCS